VYPPGPPVPIGAVTVVLLALAMVVAGDGLRRALARWLPWFGRDDPVERALVDLYLAGAGLFVVAAIPAGFALLGPLVVLGAGGTLLAVELARTVRPWERLRATVGGLRTLPRLGALGAGLIVFLVEATVAGAAATANSFDGSVDGLLVALVQRHGGLVGELAPVASGPIVNPLGGIVWSAAFDVLGGLPTVRGTLYVVPLFLALAPLGGYVVGRRWWGSDTAGGVVAVVMAFLVPGTRYLVGSGYDLDLAFPLVLLLAGLVAEPHRGVGWDGRGALAFGGMAGFAAAIDPVGIEWILLLIVAGALLGRPRTASALGPAAARLFAALAFGIAFLLPSLAGLALGGGTPSTPGSAGAFVAGTDPFLLRSTDVALAPFGWLRAELVLLIIAGAGLLLVRSARPSPDAVDPGRWLVAGVVAGLAGVALALAPPDLPLLGAVRVGESAAQMSVLLFTVYGFVAAVPLVALVERATDPPAGLPAGTPPTPLRHRRWTADDALSRRRFVILGCAALLVVPGAVATTTELPPWLAGVYDEFGHVTDADFEMLAWCAEHLPNGDRVLVAPGSAGEFLPAYDTDLALVFPMTGPAWTSNGSYLDLRASLPNGTLGPRGANELAWLGIDAIVVTGATSVLFPAFEPAAFLGNASFPVLYHSGDAYVFGRSAGA